jgi:hypothetical protein
LTWIFSWYICIPNIIWIHLTITEKMNGNCHYQECDGWTDREPDGHHHTIIRPVFNGRIKTFFSIIVLDLCFSSCYWISSSWIRFCSSAFFILEITGNNGMIRTHCRICSLSRYRNRTFKYLELR